MALTETEPQTSHEPKQNIESLQLKANLTRRNLELARYLKLSSGVTAEALDEW